MSRASHVPPRSRRIILIDGHSGSGKTTYARRLGEQLGFGVVHLDDFYPGWGGLAAATRMVARDVLDPEHPGFRRWDWQHGQPGEWVDLNPRSSYIVEGAGAITAGTIAAARAVGEVHTIRLEADAAQRRQRALRRDPGYAPWWQMWAEQERVHFSGPGNVEVDEVIYT